FLFHSDDGRADASDGFAGGRGGRDAVAESQLSTPPDRVGRVADGAAGVRGAVSAALVPWKRDVSHAAHHASRGLAFRLPIVSRFERLRDLPAGFQRFGALRREACASLSASVGPSTSSRT